jgi:hypothetical protein
MSATPILAHQIAGGILLFYAFLAILFCRPRRSEPQPPLTHRDVDLRYCTPEELEYMIDVLLNDNATEAEQARLYEVNEELKRRGR